MMVVDTAGWLTDVRRVHSPNFDARPAGTAIELVVIHNISLPPGRYGGDSIERLFTNTLHSVSDRFLAQLAATRVSAHLLIRRDGAVTQFVSFADRAWHAGASAFNERSDCNNYSVGIEVEGTDFEPFADVQYLALNRVLTSLLAAYPINAVAGHSDVARERKTDPGPFFDWHLIAVPSSISLPHA